MANLIRTNHHHQHIPKKRKRGESRVFRLKTFGESGHPAELNELSFRDNLAKLLEFGHFESSGLMGSWSFQLEIQRHPNPLYVLLFVVEEPIEAYLNLRCNHCQYVGWGNQMICNKKYHFVIPSKETMAAFLKLEGGGYTFPEKESLSHLVELQGHVLHGLFHSNGFGHLLSVNGIETGSDLTGHQVMDLWDRLCTGLKARKIGLNDASHKKGMELRLLHGVAKGEPWFGRWGYRFGSGTYGVTQKIYEKALESVRNIPLCLLNHHLTSLNRETPILLSKYQSLSTEPLITLSDLFRFMLNLHSRLPRDNYMNNSRNQIISIDSTNCRWSQKRIQMAIKVVIESLKRVEYRWISRQEVRDAARNYIGDTGLLDFVLKSLGNQVVGNYLVRRSLNPVKKVLEYCLEDISNLLPSSNNELITLQNQNSMGKMATNGHNKITRGQVMKDMFYFYKHILMDYKGVLGPIGSILNQIGMASRAILDAKYFIKEYHYIRDTPAKTLHLDRGDKLGIFCTIAWKCHHHNNEIKIPPQECIVVKKDATLSEVYGEAERVFREIYWELRDVVVESMADGQREITRVDEMAMNWNKGLVLEGNVGMMMNIEVMKCYEDDDRKKDKRIECECGAKEEDGERMVCCDICEVWQHTRCVGVQHNEEVPRIFLCQSCDQHLIPLSFLP
ncbi:Zinc finger FYVE/PHD-type [Arabidopsis suecica]|uniref:Zinc finger FYVE/PHD-type n=1 Tax=Arabidopsis suecica TaxID=45249 RepID=A0A8T1ZDE0_ARASU|nr:Zinc finger FYVE/PHD-type [Arabidopsis suecica]